MDKLENTDEPVLVCSVQPTSSCLVDKALNVISDNQEAVIILALAFFLWGLGKGVSEVVAKLKQ